MLARSHHAADRKTILQHFSDGGANGGSECSAEATACAMDATCAACLPTSSASDGSCEGDISTCSDLVDNACCFYGASCSANALLVSYLGERSGVNYATLPTTMVTLNISLFFY